jgi:pyruvyl transferase EpsO
MTRDSASQPAVPARLGDQVLESIRALAADCPAHGLLDFPSHWNIGDSAIWMGEVAILRRLHGRAPDFVSQVQCSPAEPERFLPPEGLIYLHGGGNFGDIWPIYQEYRIAVMERNPGRRIIQLPQSLHFGKPEGILPTQRAIAAHRDFHLMVRDHESHDFATRHFDCPVYLVPDSAFGIDMAAFPRHAAPRGIKALLRTDKEQRPDAAAGRGLLEGAVIEDWDAQARPVILAEKVLRRTAKRLAFAPAVGLRETVYTALARDRVRLGFAQLDEAEVVVTDRLHGHIMASLLGKPHVVIDNFYGKIANFIRAWGKDDVTLQARDYAEAAGMANALLERARAG